MAEVHIQQVGGRQLGGAQQAPLPVDLLEPYITGTLAADVDVCEQDLPDDVLVAQRAGLGQCGRQPGRQVRRSNDVFFRLGPRRHLRLRSAVPMLPRPGSAW